MPSNVVANFGIRSGVTIPVAITHNLGINLVKINIKCVYQDLVGLTWSWKMLSEVGPLNFVRVPNINGKFFLQNRWQVFEVIKLNFKDRGLFHLIKIYRTPLTDLSIIALADDEYGVTITE
jgi:hypothetical protein